MLFISLPMHNCKHIDHAFYVNYCTTLNILKNSNFASIAHPNFKTLHKNILQKPIDFVPLAQSGN